MARLIRSVGPPRRLVKMQESGAVLHTYIDTYTVAEVQNEFLRWSRGAISAYVGIPRGARGSRTSTSPGVLTKFYEAR